MSFGGISKALTQSGTYQETTETKFQQTEKIWFPIWCQTLLLQMNQTQQAEPLEAQSGIMTTQMPAHAEHIGLYPATATGNCDHGNQAFSN